MKVESAFVKEFSAGWLVLLAVTIAYGCGSALFMYSSNLFVMPIQSVTGWTRGDIAIGTSITLVLNGIGMPLCGMLTDRYGSRIVGISAMIGYGLCLLALGALPLSLPAYYALMTIMALFVSGTGAVVFARLIAARFDRARGTAIAIMYSGTPIVLSLLVPHLTAAMTAHYRPGFLILAAMALLVGLPAAIIAVRSERRDQAASQEAAEPLTGLSLGQALRTAAFWQLGIGIFGCAAALGGMLYQLSPVLADRGLSKDELGLMASLFAISVLVGRLVVGVLLDMLNPAFVAAALMWIAGAGMLLLLKGEPTLVNCSIVAAMAGCAMGAESDFGAFFAARFFGHASFSTILGSVSMFIAAGLASSSYIYGNMYDHLGSYDHAITFSVIAFLISGAVFATMAKLPVFAVPRDAALEPVTT